MVTLADLAGSLESIPALVKGKTVQMTALSARATELIRRADRPPYPELGPDPAKGMTAPWIPNFHDANYQAAMSEWAFRIRVVDMAAAIDLEVVQASTGRKMRFDPSMPIDDCRAWATAAHEALTSMLTKHEINSLADTQVMLQAGMVEEARKNSSRPSSPSEMASSLEDA